MSLIRCFFFLLFVDKNTINKSQFTKHSETFQSNFYPIDTYANVVNWLDSTPSLPLFSKPIKVKRQRDFPIEVSILSIRLAHSQPIAINVNSFGNKIPFRYWITNESISAIP